MTDEEILGTWHDTPYGISGDDRLLRFAREVERRTREADAKVCEGELASDELHERIVRGYNMGCQDCAAAIRAGSGS